MTNSVLMTLDGTAHDFDAPFLAADDLAAVRGDGIFETLLVRAGRAQGVRLHLERLVNSAHALGLPEPDVDQWSSAIEAAVKTWDDGQPNGAEGLLRLVYSRGRESEPGSTTAYLTVTAVPDRVMQARSEGVSVVTLERGFSVDLAEKAPWQLLGAKTLSYATNMAALRHAAEQGFDDVIFLSSEGAVLEGPRSTVIAVTGKALVTPPTEIGILPGTTARAVFELAAQEGWSTSTRVLRPADLIAADSVWMVSSVTLAARVTALNRYVMPVSAANDEFVDLVDRAVCVD
ncbi:aminotransferase class IV [Gordonia bronchialis DSM 43247]|uniref:Aminotransferase class IV n=1 Tax=Gordonia bronchialis (strain ATCC 25592 / DSM 43247 / BCRC 13721 / JCM 3198 / KCTC 3076 / NBRC 16047 / NCTC 10667) TaxID=526226 RepID=D0L440_GORB4|nr:aminodeoxychorismate lyase [Gordonia bronchialis]ACY20264.1 aminotransferase class IV [Gordonia bronchialis DSM 43247]MCC3323037.1 aminodeoxychorismate lyase [Gordonia bronchialis]QGS25919.1 aminodeoxychorismate lyase [Gordonia bronchialis]